MSSCMVGLISSFQLYISEHRFLNVGRTRTMIHFLIIYSQGKGIKSFWVQIEKIHITRNTILTTWEHLLQMATCIYRESLFSLRIKE